MHDEFRTEYFFNSETVSFVGLEDDFIWRFQSDKQASMPTVDEIWNLFVDGFEQVQVDLNLSTGEFVVWKAYE